MNWHFPALALSMAFPTTNFALFFLLVFLISWGLKGLPTLRKAFLVVASYVFYDCAGSALVPLLLASSLLAYGTGVCLSKTGSVSQRLWLIRGAVTLLLIPLVFFKYYKFTTQNVGDLTASLGFHNPLPLLDIVPPVAISFFTFHCISYVVDVYRGKVAATRSLIDLLLYIAFFPQLVAGPIVRAAFFMPQLEAPVVSDAIPFARALLLIVQGLFKKVVIATWLASALVDPVFLDPGSHGPMELLLAAFGYAVQIYCDFSAYTDIATGVALLLGYRFPQNFNQPYRATSVQDFWRRWHMSLSTWLREYLYIPLGGNRHGTGRTYVNLWLTMFLGGLWHGAAWTFIIWGALHGSALIIERAVRPYVRWTTPVWLSTTAVFLFVCLTWIFFRASSVGVAFDYLAGFANVHAPLQHITVALIAVIALALASQFLPPDSLDRAERRLQRLPTLALGMIAGAAVVVIDAWGPDGVAPFIYFQF